MRIGLDVMGGDYAPQEPVLGAIAAQNHFSSEITIVLIGDQDTIQSELKKNNADPSNFEIVHAPDVITMEEHPTKAIARKPESSIVCGFQLLRNKKIDVFIGAGNTGAMMVGAMYTVKAVPGVIRPSIASLLPKENGEYGVLLDVGANADCKPDVLYQFAFLGSMFAEHVYKIKKPKVALLNIGEEEEKGNLLTQAAHSIMKDTNNLNFVGNVEGRDLFNGKADVIVCDGFTGNVVLKQAESFYYLIKKRGMEDEYFEKFNYEIYGGCPILGVNAPVVVGHGISKAKSYKNMISMAIDLVDSKLSDKIREQFS